MNYLNTTQTVIENIAAAQKHFIDGVVASTKTFTATSDRTPLFRGLKTTEGILLSGINAGSELANSLAATITSIDNLPAPAAKATKRVQDFAQKVYDVEGKLVKNTFATIERYIPATGEGSFLNALKTPVQTVLDLSKKAIEFPAKAFKAFTAKTETAVATAEAKVEAAVEKTEDAVKEVAAKLEKKAAK